MRVLVVATEVAPSLGGMQTWTMDLIRGLAARQEVAVVCPNSADTMLLKTAGAKFVYGIDRMVSRTIVQPQRVVDCVLQSAAQHRADIVHLAQAGLAFLAPALNQAGFSVVLTVHGNDLTRPWLHVERIPEERRADHFRECFRSVRRVTTMSRHSRRLAIKAGAPPPVARIPPAVDAVKFSPGDQERARVRFGLPLDRPVILSVGRLMERKGHLDVVAALTGLVQYNPLYVIAGDGPMSPVIANRLCELDLQNYVRLLGAVPDKDLVTLYRAADIFTLPTHPRVDKYGLDCEGFGIVYLEAAACSLPVIAADSGGVSDAVIDGTTGYLVPPRDTAALAAALESLLTDKPKAAAFGAAARERISREFTRRQLTKRMERMYAEVLSSAPSTAP